MRRSTDLTFSRLVEDTSSGTTTGDSSTLATYGQQTDWSHEFVSTITNSGGTAYGELRIRRGTVSGISGRITNSAINTSTNLLDIATQGSRVPDGWDFYDIRIVSNTGYQIDGSNLDYHVMSANSALVSTRWNDADRISFNSVSGTMSSNFTLITEGNFTTPRVANIPNWMLVMRRWLARYIRWLIQPCKSPEAKRRLPNFAQALGLCLMAPKQACSWHCAMELPLSILLWIAS